MEDMSPACGILRVGQLLVSKRRPKYLTSLQDERAYLGGIVFHHTQLYLRIPCSLFHGQHTVAMGLTTLTVLDSQI
jgi:hypothetical protein